MSLQCWSDFKHPAGTGNNSHTLVWKINDTRKIDKILEMTKTKLLMFCQN